jgi:hypothetical protein
VPARIRASLSDTPEARTRIASHAIADGYMRAAAERLAFVQQREGGEVSGPENLDFFTDKSLVDDPYDYYDAIRRCPIWREPAHGVVMVSGYDEAIAVQRDTDQTLSVCNIVSGPWSGIPTKTDSDDISDLIERPAGQQPTAPDPRCGRKVEQWPHDRSFACCDVGGERSRVVGPGKLFGATLRAIFRHTANRRLGRILAA